MARLVMKSPYLKPNKQTSIKRYVKYIATREGVEIVDNSKNNLPATVAQQRFIKQLLRDVPEGKELHEYDDYIKNPTRSNASELINSVIETQADAFESREKYVSYIAQRPRVEKLGEHGLFSDEGLVVNLSEVQKEVAESESNVWTHIISLKREDAERLGYNNASAWMKLLREHRDDIAKAMRIHPDDFRWYAAFHNEAHHPHVHMIAYSVGGRKPYLDQEGIEKIKSVLASDIFKNERINIYQQQTKKRDEIKSETRAIVSDFIQEINSGALDNPKIELLLQELAEKLSTHKGKKVYGYLREDAKAIVDSIVDELEKDDGIKSLYDDWYERKFEILRFYTDTIPEKVPLSQNKTFKSIKNMIIQEANSILLDKKADEDFIEPEEASEISSDYLILLAQAKEGKYWTQYKLAKHYMDQNNKEYDPDEAVYWFEKCVSRGNTYAAFLLSKAYLKGEQIPQDIPKAVHLLEYAANDGNNYAAYTLGKLLYEGKIVVQDTENGLKYLKQSADAGNTYAAYQLGRIYLYGICTDKDFNLAIDYLNASASNGNDYAAQLLEAVKQNRYALAASSGLSVIQSIALVIQDKINEQERKKFAMQHAREQVDKKEREKTDEKKRAHGQKVSM